MRLPELSATRLPGIDVARGLAVLGMICAHVGAHRDFDFARPDTWLGITDGRSSILFATLAGVSIALMSGRTAPVRGEELVRVRLRILIRAVVIFALGGLLIMLATRVGIILEFYAVMFAVSLPFLRLPARRLFELAVLFALLAPLIDLLLIDGLRTAPRVSAIVQLVVTGQYPVLIWLAFLFAGLGIGRLDLASTAVRVRLILTGTGLAAFGYGVGVYLGRALAALEGGEVIFTVEPHSGSMFEVIGSGGFAMAVIGVCLIAADRVRLPLFPLEATGAMALSVYSLHIVAIAGVGDEAFEQSDYGLYVAFLVVTLVAATLWRLALGAGPFESVLASVTRRATDPAAPAVGTR